MNCYRSPPRARRGGRGGRRRRRRARAASAARRGETPARVSDQDDDVERIESYAARGVHDRGEDDERRGWGRRRRRGTDVHAHESQRRVRAGRDGDYVSFTLPRVEDWKRHRTQRGVIQQIRSEIGAKIKVCEQVNDADERIICVSSIDDGLAPMISRKSPCFASTGASSRAVVTTFPSRSDFSCRRRKSGVSSVRVAASSNRFAAKPAPPCASCRRALPACANEDDELLEIGQWPADACALGIRIVSGRLRGNMRHKAAERMSAAKPAAPTSSRASPSPPPPPRDVATSRAHVHRNDADRVRAHGSNHRSPQRRVRPAFDARGDRSGRHRRQQRAHDHRVAAHRKRVGSRRRQHFNRASGERRTHQTLPRRD